MKLTVLFLAFLVSVSYQTEAEDEVKMESDAADSEVKVGRNRDPRFFFLFRTLYFTSTTWTTTTSTATTATIISCIPSTLFMAGSTTGCRRKRGIMEDSNILELESISPSERLEVVPTELPAEVKREEPEPNLDSSMPEVEEDQEQRHVIHKRFLYTYITTTYTYTSTSISFTATSFTKTVSPVKAVSLLACLPAGYTLC